MNEQGKIVTREELHAAVWESQIFKLAQSWGMPAYGIAKACKKMNVPRPDARHWQLIRRGRKIEPVALPPAARWLAWARRHADRVDPVSAGYLASLLKGEDSRAQLEETGGAAAGVR